MRLFIAIILGAWALLNASAQIADGGETDRAKEATKLTRKFANAVHIQTPESPQLVIEVVDRSLLKWSNPVTGSLHASVYLWASSDGRPIAIASVIKWYSPRDRLEAELHSQLVAFMESLVRAACFPMCESRVELLSVS